MRTIYLTPRVITLLDLMDRLGRRPDGYVFGHRRGPWTPGSVGQKFRKWRDKLVGSGVVPYSMRHSYCTDAIVAGISYADLGKMVGNSASTLERYYDHPVRDRLKDRAEEVDRLRRMG